MNIGKIIVGIVILLAGLWLIVPKSICSNITYCPGLWQELVFVLKGVLPITLVILGIFVLWVEAAK